MARFALPPSRTAKSTHFFQNLASCNVGFFTVNEDRAEGFVDWDWLMAQAPVRSSGCVHHIRFDDPVEIVMIGQEHRGIIRKP